MLASELLAVWEGGLTQTPPARALVLLATADPGTTPEALAKLTAGRVAARLLELRERIFGPHMTGLAECISCHEHLEVDLNAGDIRGAAGVSGDEVAAAPPELSWSVGDVDVRFCLPTSRDLLAACTGRDVEDSRSILLSRCVLEAHADGEPVAATDLPDLVADAVTEEMGAADPMADVRLELVCPSCGHRWDTSFDIASFLWTEVDGWAQRILGEVHALAFAYGWAEADILAMHPSRRQAYLEMAGT